MADDNKKQSEDNNSRKPTGGGRMQPSTIAVWIAIIGGMVLLFTMKEKWGEPPYREISSYDFNAKVASNLIAHARVNVGQQSSLTDVTGTYYEVDGGGNKQLGADGQPLEVPFRTKILLTETFADRLREVKQIELRENSALWVNVGINVLFLLVMVFFIWFFFIRPIRMAGKAARSRRFLIFPETARQSSVRPPARA